MALAIATNNAALNAAASASSVNRDMETSMARLSSGKRINSASDDAAGVAISSRYQRTSIPRTYYFILKVTKDDS